MRLLGKPTENIFFKPPGKSSVSGTSRNQRALFSVAQNSKYSSNPIYWESSLRPLSSKSRKTEKAYLKQKKLNSPNSSYAPEISLPRYMQTVVDFTKLVLNLLAASAKARNRCFFY